jgi:hypothetical protein
LRLATDMLTVGWRALGGLLDSRQDSRRAQENICGRVLRARPVLCRGSATNLREGEGGRTAYIYCRGGTVESGDEPILARG